MTNRFLRARAGRYDFRRRIPDDLVSRFGKREIIRSLGSLPYVEAVEKARRLTVITDRLFRMIARKPELTTDQITDLVEDWFSRRLEDQERWREQFRPENPEQEFRADQIAQDRADGAMELIRMNDIDAAAETTEALLQAHGIAIDRASPAYADLARAILRANAEAARVHAARLRGDYTVRPSDPLLAQALSAERRPQKKGNAIPALTEAWARFSGEKTKAEAWRQSMAHDAEQALALFTESAGDRRLDSYSRQDVSEFVAMLQALPAHRNKRPAFKGKTLTELVDLAKADPSLETLAPKTVKKYANLVSSFFAWSVAQGFITENIASAVYKAPKRTVRRNAERAAWSIDQLRTLFSSPIYTGSKSAARRSESGAVVVHDADWWLPVLGLFHPCRLEELAQLRVEDVKEQDGILYFDIHDGDDGDGKTPGRRLKSLAAVRKVPVHRVALELGFKKYVAERRRKNDVMLWPELAPGGIAKRLGFAYSKRFGRYRKAVGLDGVDFHALRHNSITALVQSQVHPDIISQLSGHEVAGERGRYSKGADLPDLKTAIDAIAYPGIDAALIAKR